MRKRCLLLLLFSALASRTGFADDWPTRPIQIIAAFGAGGTVDIIAHMMGDKHSAAL
jgi:tripartite-type tricarboxylate transporter receptor subunit TctC